MTAEIPTCSLRKPCGWCGEPFGRKLRTNNRTKNLYLVPIYVWEATPCCSKICGRRLRAANEKAQKELSLAAESSLNAFLGGTIH